MLTELGSTRAVYENPSHDFQQRIAYELPAEGRLSAWLGFAKGGRPRSFEFERKGNSRSLARRTNPRSHRRR